MSEGTGQVGLISLINTTIWKKRVKKQKKARVNEWIRISPVRVVDEDGTQLGVKETREALSIAQEKGLDLVEVAPNARPPVCRIMDYGKYLYQQEKNKRQVKHKSSKVKEIKIGFSTQPHDLEFKTKKIKEFLAKAHRVKVSIFLKGRERRLVREAGEKLNQFLQDLGGDLKKERMERLQGNRGFSVLIEGLVRKGEPKAKPER